MLHLKYFLTFQSNILRTRRVNDRKLFVRECFHKMMKNLMADKKKHTLRIGVPFGTRYFITANISCNLSLFILIFAKNEEIEENVRYIFIWNSCCKIKRLIIHYIVWKSGITPKFQVSYKIDSAFKGWNIAWTKLR